MTNSFEEMYAKSTTIDFLRQVTLLFAYVLTIFGTISIVDLIIYLKEMMNFKWDLICASIIILPLIYSNMCNFLLNKIEKKIDNMSKELAFLEEEKKVELISKYGIDNIKERFESLSKEKKLRLLYDVKNDILFNELNCYMIARLMEDNKKECSDLVEKKQYICKKKINNK